MFLNQLPLSASTEECTKFVEQWCQAYPNRVQHYPLANGSLDLFESWFLTRKRQQKKRKHEVVENIPRG